MKRITISILDSEYEKLEALTKDTNERLELKGKKKWKMKDLIEVWTTCRIVSEYKTYKLLNNIND